MKTLEVSSAVGEVESGSFVVRATTDIPDLTFSIESQNAATVGASAISIRLRYVKVWFQSGTAWWSIRQDKSRPVLVPELLVYDDNLVRVDLVNKKNFVKIRDSYVDISQDRAESGRNIVPSSKFPIQDATHLTSLSLQAANTRQIWVTVNVQPVATAGQYVWRLRVASAMKGINFSIPLVVNVLPFALEQPALEYSLYYRGYIDAEGQGSISSETKSENQLRAELVNMFDHGVTNPTVYQPPGSTQLFQRVLRVRRDVGMYSGCVYYLGITTGNYTDAGSIQSRLGQYKRLRQAANRYGVPCLDVYGVDEAEAKDIVGQFPVWGRFTKLGAGLFAAAWRDGPAERKYAGQLKFLVLGIEPDAAVNAVYKQAGTRIYLYNQPQVGVENPLTYRINYGLQAWRLGFDGVMNYAYQDSMGFIWNDFDHPDFRDHVFAYPTSNGVIDTLAWEGFREAIDDVRYVTTLQKLAKQTGSLEASRAVARVREMQGIDPVRTREYIASQIVRTCTQFADNQRTHRICVNAQ